MKNKSILAVALTFAVALIASVGLTSEAFAAASAFSHAPGAIGKIGDFVIQNSHFIAGSLVAMRADLESLTRKAKDKAAEVRDGMSEEDIKRIEDDHSEMLRKIEKLKDDIAVEEAAEASRNQPAPVDPNASASEVAIRNATAVAVRQALDNERNRTSQIRALGDQFGATALATQHAGMATSVEQFRGILIDHLATDEGRSGMNITSNVRVEMGQSDHEKRAAAITNALLHRASPSTVELTAEGRNFRSMTLLELGRDILEARGVNTRGMTKTELAAAALETRTGGLHTTSDFPGILSNVANTTLRAAYVAAPQTFRPLVRVTSVSDFKAVTRAQLGEAPALNKVNEHGEFKRGTLGEGSESYKIATYGKIVGITRQVIINDDLNAFSRLPAAFGVQAAQLESDLVWGQILSNPVMGDGKTLFHADHKNLLTGAAIAVPSMSAARVSFSTQTGLDGKTVLGLMPRYMIVPVALQTLAEQFKGQIYAAKNADVVPDSLKQFSIISEPRLDVGINRPEDGIVAAGSATAWYLGGDPALTDIVELAYLDGNQGVYTETRTGFDIDGVEVKVRLDVGAKVLDYRNIAKNPGA